MPRVGLSLLVVHSNTFRKELCSNDVKDVKTVTASRNYTEIGMALIERDSSGFYCEPGRFHIDPSLPVPKALITHAHSGHVSGGCGAYLCSTGSVLLLREMLGPDASIETIRYGESRRIGDATVSFHPAGHILGSAQIRIEYRGEVWVVSGDYKLDPDPTCAPFEPVPCNVFVTESTFGLPIYRWPSSAGVLASIENWHSENTKRGKRSVMFADPWGKAQRLLAGLGPAFCHEDIKKVNDVYRASGIALPEGEPSDSLVIAPPSAQGTPWMKQFGPVSTALASGWMRIRGKRRYQSIDVGFVLSDHADCPGLQQAIRETGAESVGVSHGYKEPMVRWLQEQGKQAWFYELAPL
jgi:putative mRNA 3-end processing factor